VPRARSRAVPVRPLPPRGRAAQSSPEIVHCVVIGFEPKGAADFAALIIATESAGKLRCVGTVDNGFDRRQRVQANRFLRSHLRDRPLVPQSKHVGQWVEFGLFCAVQHAGRAAGGQLITPAVVQVFGL
jgi:ATP-dependent DNA ligase